MHATHFQNILHQLLILCALSIETNLFIRFAASKTKYQQVPMRICTGKMLSILWKLTVKYSSMPLSFNLENTEKGHDQLYAGASVVSTVFMSAVHAATIWLLEKLLKRNFALQHVS